MSIRKKRSLRAVTARLGAIFEMEPKEFEVPIYQWDSGSFTTIEDEFGVTLPDDVLDWSINRVADWIMVNGQSGD